MGIRVAARSWIARCVLAAVWLLAAANARAAGTPAGTPISNTATVSYDVGADSYTQSATAVFTVDERIDVVVGAVLTGVIGLFVVVACAATLHVQGIEIDEARDAATALTLP